MRLLAVGRKIEGNRIISIAVVLLIIAGILFVYTGRTFGNQATRAIYPGIVFNGMYKISDGDWTPYISGEHIPADRGTVYLKGNFEAIAPDTNERLGRPSAETDIAFYLDHINISVSEDGGDELFFDTELDVAGEDMCGVMYSAYRYMGGEEILITIRNPHSFGNGKAIDSFLNNLSAYGGTDFENDMQNRGNIERIIGIVLILTAFMILGTGIFLLTSGIKNAGNILLAGLVVFFAAVYFIFSAHGIMYMSEIVKFNTRTLGLSVMLYIFFMMLLITSVLKKNFKSAFGILTAISGLLIFAILIVCFTAEFKIYDVLGIWTAMQSIICLVMTVFLVRGFTSCSKKTEMLYAFGMLPMIAFVADCIFVYFSVWQGGVISRVVFLFLYTAAFVVLLNFIFKSVGAPMRARELEAEKQALKAELAESRIATMISQIQPHFIYNTLGTIEQLCLSDPDAASTLVHNFSLYLRGNFSELDNTRPIRFSQEMNHVKHYTDIEQVRFPDMTIQYDLRSVDFFLPALSIQPLVENAIKHGLMGLEKGGIVTISAYETKTHYVVEVKDDGVGFDSDAGYDESKHVGIKNIRGRIEAMCDGKLTIKSKKGMGTRATVKIPKEGTGNGSNNS